MTLQPQSQPKPDPYSLSPPPVPSLQSQPTVLPPSPYLTHSLAASGWITVNQAHPLGNLRLTYSQGRDGPEDVQCHLGG